VNVEGYMPGNNFVILGSGDIGMIMARRLTFEGAHVERVLEIQSYLSGLSRNYVQCLDDWGIPLQLQYTVKKIIGKNRVEAIEAVAVDDKWNFIPGSEEIIPCDTLLLSVGLIPENELSKKAGVLLDPVTGGPYVDEHFQTSVPGIFAAGNVVHVYDLVDYVSMAGSEAGRSAAEFALAEKERSARYIPLVPGKNVRYIVPHKLDKQALEKGISVCKCALPNRSRKMSGWKCMEKKTASCGVQSVMCARVRWSRSCSSLKWQLKSKKLAD